MKLKFYFSAILLGLLLSSCGKNNASIDSSSTPLDSMSYALGIDIGEQLIQNPELKNLNADIIASAIKDLQNGEPKMDKNKAFAYIQNFFNHNALKQFEEKNKAAGEKFLEENKNKEGVISLPSGLQYKVNVLGSGPKPKTTDTVEVHYRGTLIDGREFDSSYKRGETVTFPLTGVIKGWTEGLQQINEGSKITLYIPQELAYGKDAPGGIIEPYMALIFDIELVKIIPQEQN